MLYLDDKNLLNDCIINDLELNVYPNPLSSDQSLSVSYTAGENPVELILRDVQGKIMKD